MDQNTKDIIKSYHAHVYYDAQSLEQARDLCQRISEKFELKIGTFHQKNVGPHPRWSCQISIEKGKFGRALPWLMKNRRGLTIFVHPNTGNDLKDHTDYALWMGELLKLNLEVFNDLST